MINNELRTRIERMVNRLVVERNAWRDAYEKLFAANERHIAQIEQMRQHIHWRNEDDISAQTLGGYPWSEE